MYKQLIVVRKDLDMSAGKLAAQVAHASMAFLANQIKEKANVVTGEVSLKLDQPILSNWFFNDYTKVILQAKNKTNLLKIQEMCRALGLYRDRDYFLIYDRCYTELQPEENGQTLTCIGFKPMEYSILEPISKKYHIYVDTNKETLAALTGKKR